MRICFIVKRNEEVEDFSHWQVFVCQSHECFWWQTHLLFFIVLFFLNIIEGKKKGKFWQQKQKFSKLYNRKLALFIFKRRNLNYFNGYLVSFCVGKKDSSWGVPGKGESTCELYSSLCYKNIVIWWLVDVKLHCVTDCRSSFFKTI